MKVTHVPEFAFPIHVLIGPETVAVSRVTRVASAEGDSWKWWVLGFPLPKKLSRSKLIYENPFVLVYPKKMPALIEKLKTWANDTGEGGQLLTTTQSPYVVSQFEPEQVSYVRQVRNDLELYRLSDCPQVKLGLARGDFCIGELWWNFPDEEWLGLKSHPPTQMCRIPLVSEPSWEKNYGLHSNTAFDETGQKRSPSSRG